MKRSLLRKVIPLALSAGMVFSLPAVLPQTELLSAGIYAQAEAAAKAKYERLQKLGKLYE